MFSEVENLLNSEKSFNIPFPMGVFGTLREGQYNHHLMRLGTFYKSQKAFMPNFVAEGLSLKAKAKATAPFEVYFYNREEWNKIIERVDALESFSPRMAGLPGSDTWSYGGYYRTLSYLHILPDEYDLPTDLWGERNLGIPENEWEKYERIPCWVYSNRKNNSICNGYPIIWG